MIRASWLFHQRGRYPVCFSHWRLPLTDSWSSALCHQIVCSGTRFRDCNMKQLSPAEYQEENLVWICASHRTSLWVYWVYWVCWVCWPPAGGGLSAQIFHFWFILHLHRDPNRKILNTINFISRLNHQSSQRRGGVGQKHPFVFSSSSTPKVEMS